MLSIQRILFPTDFSEGATRAFPQAVRLADWHDAELHIVNVTEPSTASKRDSEKTLPVSPEILSQWFGQDAEKSDSVLSNLTLVQKQIESGVPSERLLAYVEDRDIDLVVMGTHGRRGVRRMLLGSVTEDVLRKVPCPVLTVTEEAEAATSKAVQRILVPVDFSDASEIAVQHATEIAHTYGAEIDLLHVVEEVVYPSAYGVEPALFPTEEVVARVEETLGEMVREDIGDEHVHVSATVGYAPMTILDYIEDNDVDLLVIATHGRSGVDRLLLGSVAERVLRRSPVPVFLVKPDQKSLLTPTDAQTATAAE